MKQRIDEDYEPTLCQEDLAHQRDDSKTAVKVVAS